MRRKFNGVRLEDRVNSAVREDRERLAVVNIDLELEDSFQGRNVSADTFRTGYGCKYRVHSQGSSIGAPAYSCSSVRLFSTGAMNQAPVREIIDNVPYPSR